MPRRNPAPSSCRPSTPAQVLATTHLLPVSRSPRLRIALCGPVGLAASPQHRVYSRFLTGAKELLDSLVALWLGVDIEPLLQ